MSTSDDRPDASGALDRCLAVFETELDFILQALRRQGFSEADAEDVVQDVFLVMWRRWADYDPRRPLRAWLAGMAFRVAYRHRGRRGREVPGGLFDVTDQRPTPEDDANQSSYRALVARVLAELSEREQVVLRAHEVDGVPMQDIADALAIPLQTAYTRLRAARRNFARLLRRMDTVVGARAELGLTPALLRANDDIPPTPPERRRRAINRVRALVPLLPARPTIEGDPATTGAAETGTSLPGRRGRLILPALALGGLVALWAVLLPRSDVPPGRPAEVPADIAATPNPFDRAAVPRLTAAPAPSFLSVAPPPPLPLADAGPPPIEAGGLHRGLLGYWRFDDGRGNTLARDLSGRGNDCQLRGRDGGWAWTEGPLGGAIELTGQGWLECPRVEGLAALSSELTIAMWMKRTGTKAHVRALVSRQYGKEGSDHFHLGFRDETLWLRSLVKGTAAGGRPKVQRGRWYHVAGTIERNGVARVYLDGEEVGRKLAASRPHLGGGSNPMLIGAGYNGPDTRISERLQGVIDELVMYERALAPEEIRALARRFQPTINREP